ncbi:MAG: 30S ribosomal protein S16 [Firmicutes bacterium]|nr:30S ribosomal protein S16 [Bacillota bacterium]
MATKIRLTRLGDKKSPFYRIVVADSRTPRDGAAIATLGTFDPLVEKDGIKVDKDAALDWIAKGALPTDTARSVLVKAGVLEPKPYKAKANAKPATPKAKKKEKKG